MGKAKKTKKDVAQDESADTDAEVVKSEVDASESSKEKNTKEKKKATKKVSKDQDSDDSDVDEVAKNIKNLNVASKKKGKKKGKGDDDDDGDEEGLQKTSSKPGFSLLMGDSDDNDEDDQKPSSEPEEEIMDTKSQKSNKGKKPTNVSEDKTAGGKKGKKARKKRNDSDEDIDKVLAELELEYSGVSKPESKSNESSKQNKEAGVKNEDETGEGGEAENEEQGNGADSTVKTAAQKKKEKKERQKREAALAAKQQADDAGNADGIEGTIEVGPKKKQPTKKTKETIKPEEVPENENGAEDDKEKDDKKDDKEKDDKKDDKKSKKKGKADKKEKEEDKSKKKGISSAMVAAMQERLAKVKEEEERLKKEEELRIQREEELENMRLEKLRLEAERKEKKKQREHERKARLKAEGKLLTAKQKQDKARAQAMLESLRAQGVELPEVGEKRPRPGTRVRPNKKKDTLQQSESLEETDEQGESGKTDESIAQIAEEATKVDDVKEAWDASSSEDEQEAESSEKKDESEVEGESEESDEEDDDESDDEDESEGDESAEEDNRTDAEIKREKALDRIEKRRAVAEKKRTTDDLRAAVVCVLGHVDTGKTKILDKLRRTNVQDCEAGGITQQIGATNVPIDAIKEQTRIVKGDLTYKLPGLLIIDTPGHESFSNLRNRGSSLCDISILVVDIMHGLEPQTIESINILKSKKCPFVVALNKIDRLYDWQTMIRKDVRDIIKNQAPNTQLEFTQRTKEVILQFAEQGLNAALFYENPDPRSYVNLVPTSAITGEGMGNLLYLIVESCQSWLAKRLMYSEELLATVLEVKAIPGLGTTIDAILINGKLREGETMVIAGTDGPIVTQIRSLLMPQPLKELRVKNAYAEYKEVIGAQGVKIAAKELEKAIAGLNVYVAHKPDEVEICREEVARELKSALSHIKLSQEGVYVQASTLGSLEALLEFLRTSKIPYSNIRIGPVVKRDVMKASIMLEHESQYATILAFDVKIERDAQEMADSLGVKIFQADIIYHLFDQFTAYREQLKQKKREEFKNIAVFPCKLKILPQFIFNSRDPIVVGVMVEGGIVKEGTPICVPSKEFLDIGIVTSVEINNKSIESARKGQEVCIKIDPIPGDSPKMFGRHFDEKDMLTSKISRQSIDACKDYFRDDLLKADWALMVELKKLFQIL